MLPIKERFNINIFIYFKNQNRRMDSELTCPHCSKQYKQQNLPRILTMCGHTFCEFCIKDMIKPKKSLDHTNQEDAPKHKSKKNKNKVDKQPFFIQCPQDHGKMDLQTNDINCFPKNIALIKVVESKKAFIFPDEDSSINVSKIAKQDQVQEDDDAKDLITAIKENDILKEAVAQAEQKKQQSKQPQLCLLHQKQLQIVCMKDLIKICTNCAIFGQHKGHEFKGIDQIQNEKNEYYRQILEIVDKKNVIKERISNEETCNEIMGILQHRKQKLRKDIIQRYEHIKAKIQLYEQANLDKLDKIITNTEGKLKKLMQVDPNILSKYDSWEQQSYRHIKILQGNNFEDMLQLLFPLQSQNEDTILNRGYNIIQQMSGQEENLIRDVQVILDNIGTKNSDTALDTLQQFVTVHQQLNNRQNHSKTDNTINSENKNKQKYDDSTKLKESSNNMQSPQNQQSLLEMEQQQQQIIVQKPQFTKMDAQLNLHQEIKRQADLYQMNLNLSEKLQASENHNKRKSEHLKELNLPTQLTQRPNKKKLSKIKIPQKYDKLIDDIVKDNTEAIDFTNAQLGDNAIVTICQFVRGSKAKSLKLIRNKLTDDAIKKIIPYLGNIVTLNISQNMLTETVLQHFISYSQLLPNLKNLILSQNKINERKCKVKLEKLRKLQWTISV